MQRDHTEGELDLDVIDTQPNWKRLYLFGIIGLLIFLPLQFIPSTSDAFFGSESYHVIGKQEAERQASTFAEQRFGGTVQSAKAVHQSDKALIGYLSRDDLTETYESKYGADFPADTYQVEVRSKRADDPFLADLFVHVHMETGKVVAWNEVGSGLSGGGALSAEEATLAARAFAQERGFRESDLQPAEMPEADGTVTLSVQSDKIGESVLQLRIRPVSDGSGSVRIAGYKPVFAPPAEYTAYVERQDRIATLLTFAGYAFLSFVMFVLAIVYAAICRRHTSFVRGIALTAVFLGAYLYNNINLIDGIRASAGERANLDSLAAFSLLFTQLITALIAVSVYFSLVGGDGLWRSMRRNLWPRWNEDGYGEHVWRSMKIGYWFAFIIMGLQTLILILLQNVLGAWSTSDVTQSPLNMTHPWLFPLLAWCAAISEEAVYRLFGIALFRKWFRNTYAAAIIPTVVWALGHVAYPIYPSPTRLIELTLLGFVFCFIFIRYGFIAALFTHAIMDLVLMSMSLLLLGSAGNIAAAVFYVVMPLLIAWIIRTAHRNRRRQPAEREQPPFQPVSR